MKHAARQNGAPPEPSSPLTDKKNRPDSIRTAFTCDQSSLKPFGASPAGTDSRWCGLPESRGSVSFPAGTDSRRRDLPTGQKSLVGKGWGTGRGRGSLSSERGLFLSQPDALSLHPPERPGTQKSRPDSIRTAFTCDQSSLKPFGAPPAGTDSRWRGLPGSRGSVSFPPERTPAGAASPPVESLGWGKGGVRGGEGAAFLQKGAPSPPRKPTCSLRPCPSPLRAGAGRARAAAWGRRCRGRWS